VKTLETHKAYKPVNALGSKTLMRYGEENLHTCVYRDAKTPRHSIPFRDKVDCAVRIGFLQESFSEEIKHLYELRNLTHIETEAKEGIELEIEHAKVGYWRLRPFLEHIASTVGTQWLPTASEDSARTSGIASPAED